MSHDATVAIMAVSFFAVVGVTVKAIAGVWMKRLETRRQTPNALLEQRLERIETAVDAIALEVERISEAQRFAARLTAERSAGGLQAPARAPEGRIVTPH